MYTLSKESWTTKNMAKISVLAVIGWVLMLFDLPLWFSPFFLRLDISDLPGLIGSFAMGPMAGVLIQFVKNVLSFIQNPTNPTAGVGELSNFLVGSVLVYAAGFVYYRKKTFTRAIVGLGLGVILMSIFATLSNYFVIFPLYAKVMPLDAIIDAASSVNKYVVDYKSMMLYAVLPFNIFKGITVSAITLLIYKKVSPILHK